MDQDQKGTGQESSESTNPTTGAPVPPSSEETVDWESRRAIPDEPIPLRPDLARLQPDLGPRRPCLLCSWFRDLCQPALSALAPLAPPLVVSEAADVVKLHDQGPFLDICPSCAMLLQAWLMKNSELQKAAMNPEQQAAQEARSKLILPGTPGFPRG